MFKLVLSVVILFATLFLSFSLSLRMMAQYRYAQAAELLRKKQYKSCVIHLIDAIKLQGNEARNWKALGDAYRYLGRNTPLKKTYQVALNAKEAYLAASRLNSIDADTFFGLAAIERRLERLYPFFNSGPNPHNPLPYIQRAISLYPKNLLYHFFLADYYYSKKAMDALKKTIYNIAVLSPKSYFILKNRSFWKISQVKNAFQQGLLKTAQESTNRVSAYAAMASILEKEKAWERALLYYQKLPIPSEKPKAAQYYFHLGRLYENAGTVDSDPEYMTKAHHYFQKAFFLDPQNQTYQKHYEAFVRRKSGN